MSLNPLSGPCLEPFLEVNIVGFIEGVYLFTYFKHVSFPYNAKHT